MKIAIQPRVHIGLLSMHEEGYRKNGGIGFALEEPKAILEVSAARRFALVDERQNSLTDWERRNIERVVDDVLAAEGLGWSVSARLLGDARPHVGLGMGTGVRLAILEALYRLNGLVPDEDTLVRQSERGGTSGIGIRTYFHGGLVVDLGARNLDHTFLPSSRSGQKLIPPVLARTDMPSWPICLCLPLRLRPRTQAEERDFFRKTAPISTASAHEATYRALFGVYAAAADDDFDTFCAAIEALQEVEWKSQERRQYGDELNKIVDRLRQYGLKGIGMSSLGPLLYCFGPMSAMLAAKSHQEEDNSVVFITTGANRGRSLQQSNVS